MAYASFRCLVDAPFAKVWQNLRDSVQKVPVTRAGASALAITMDSMNPDQQRIHIRDRDFKEFLIIDPARGEIIIRLEKGQDLHGERRFTVRPDRDTSRLMIESSLDWSASSLELDQGVDRVLDILVREAALLVKENSES